MDEMKTEAVEAEENDNSPESSTETTETEETPSSEGSEQTENEKKPFHEDPKIRDFVERQAEKKAEQKMAQLREEYQRELAKMRDELSPKAKEEQSEEIPDWFGGDDAAWSKFQAFLGTMTKKAKQETIAELQESKAKEERLMQEATDYMKAEIAAIESDPDLNPEGKKVDSNRLYKTIQDFDLVDGKGRWNYKAAWKIMQMQQPKAKQTDLSEKKKIAAASSSTDRSVDKPAPFKTHEDFLHGRPF